MFYWLHGHIIERNLKLGHFTTIMNSICANEFTSSLVLQLEDELIIAQPVAATQILLCLNCNFATNCISICKRSCLRGVFYNYASITSRRFCITSIVTFLGHFIVSTFWKLQKLNRIISFNIFQSESITRFNVKILAFNLIRSR